MESRVGLWGNLTCACLLCVVVMHGEHRASLVCELYHNMKSSITCETNKMLIHSQLTSIQVAHQLSARQFWKHQVEDSDNADHYCANVHRSW